MYAADAENKPRQNSTHIYMKQLFKSALLFTAFPAIFECAAVVFADARRWF